MWVILEAIHEHAQLLADQLLTSCRSGILAFLLGFVAELRVRPRSPAPESIT